MNEKALLWMRKSKGDEDAIGFTQRKRAVRQLADEMDVKTDELNLGIHTGFSIHSRDSDDERLDAHPEVQDALDRIEDGEYDFVIAYNDKRVARDEYFSTIEYHMKLGGAQFVFVEDDIDRDDMAFNIQREVERHRKQSEIEDIREAIRERQELGYWQGRAPYGSKHADVDPPGLVPTEDFDRVIDIIDAKCRSKSHREALREAGLEDEKSPALVTRMLTDNPDTDNPPTIDVYRTLAEEHGYEFACNLEALSP